MITTVIRSDINADRERQGGQTRIVRLTKASTMAIRAVLWFWRDRLALGTLALIGGREGIGKSICAYTIAAQATRGRLQGTYYGTPKAVVICATEDSWEHTIVPRLIGAGADLSLIYRADVLTTGLGDAALSLPRDLESLEDAIGEVGAALIILDPLMSRLDAALDSHKDQEVRQALEPLVALADRTRSTVLGLIHVNKSASTDALTTLMGSRAFAAVARSVLFVMTDPDNEEARLLGQAKNNLGRMDLPTLGFRIVGTHVADTAEGPVWTGRLEWTGESSRSIRDALDATVQASGDKSATSEAGDWLFDYLQEHDGVADFADIRRDGLKAGHSKDSLRRAKTRHGILSATSGFPRRAFWSLPGTVDANAGETSITTTTAPNASTEGQQAHRAQRTQSSDTPREEGTTDGERL